METFDDCVLDVTARDIAIETRDENRLAALALARQTRRTLHIFTRHLDPSLYDTPPFLNALTQLVTRSRFPRIRVLVQDSEPAVKRGHRLIEFSRQFSSFIELRKPHEDYQDYNEAFLVADETGVLHRKLADQFEATVNFHAPLWARNLVKFFDEVWDRSEPDPELRRLYL